MFEPLIVFEPVSALVVVFVAVQGLYLLTFAVDAYFFTRPVDKVDLVQSANLKTADYPYIVLFYPVLHELESTMRTTMLALGRIKYPHGRSRVVAIPNSDDTATVASLRRLQREFPFLQVHEVPPTSDPSWDAVWAGWDGCGKAYWWHRGKRAYDRNLPPKKTRQLIHAFYNIEREFAGREDFLVNYIDADSCPPLDHFLAAAVGIRNYDVLQAQNVAGNLNQSLAASFHAFDHMTWDGAKYPHLSANGQHPYWVLGKGLFFKASDLMALGGFHPWLTIEDPEVGMRFWVNGKRLGIIENPLIEEVPVTFSDGIKQRKRWVAGFFQSLTRPLAEMGMRPADRFKAWLNFLPCLSLWLNAIGFPLGVWAVWHWVHGGTALPLWSVPLALLNVVLFVVSLTALYVRTWQRTALVLHRTRDRIWYLLRVNPVFLLAWWVIWLVPLAIGLRMYLRDEGLVWERTEKFDANAELVRATAGGDPAQPSPPGRPQTVLAHQALKTRIAPVHPVFVQEARNA